MSLARGVIATTHVDSAHRKITKNALEQLVKASNKQYLRLTDEHDPRKMPIGRVIGCRLIQLKDGEYAAEAIFELYDGENPVEDDQEKFLIIEHVTENENITIHYDDSYLIDNKLDKVKELNNQIKKHNDLLLSIKNSIEPISVLVLAGSFIVGKIFEGFLNKIGEDLYENFKNKLYEALETQNYRNERVLQFSLDIKKETEFYRANIFITNPKKEDIETVLKLGFKRLDSELGKYLNPKIREINIEFKNKKFEITYFLNGKAKVLIPKEEFKIIDILV
jgi:hypothetical protein